MNSWKSGDQEVVVEAFVEVGLAVAVEVVQPGDAVAAEDVNLVVDDLQAERWKRPVAKRFQVIFSSLSSMPETIQTSPDQVQTAARPSEKKSKPPKRIHES